jgi:hypothetical protein
MRVALRGPACGCQSGPVGTLAALVDPTIEPGAAIATRPSVIIFRKNPRDAVSDVRGAFWARLYPDLYPKDAIERPAAIGALF